MGKNISSKTQQANQSEKLKVVKNLLEVKSIREFIKRFPSRHKASFQRLYDVGDVL